MVNPTPDLNEETFVLNDEAQRTAFAWGIEHMIEAHSHCAERLFEAGVHRDHVISVATHAMVSVAATVSCAFARTGLGREPDPAKWREATDRRFAESVAITAHLSAPASPAPQTFEEYVTAIQALAEAAGAAEPGKPYCEQETWRESFIEGLTPAEVWRAEVDAAMDMLG